MAFDQFAETVTPKGRGFVIVPRQIFDLPLLAFEVCNIAQRDQSEGFGGQVELAVKALQLRCIGQQFQRFRFGGGFDVELIKPGLRRFLVDDPRGGLADGRRQFAGSKQCCCDIALEHDLAFCVHGQEPIGAVFKDMLAQAFGIFHLHFLALDQDARKIDAGGQPANRQHDEGRMEHCG